MKLTASVGRMAANKREDVSLVQEAFGHIKVQTKFGRQPLWPKRPDGRNSRDFEGAIACFQDLNRLKPTGKLDAYGPGLSKLKMAVPAAFRNARGVRGTAATVSGPANPAQLALRQAGSVKRSAPFPERERTALADGILRSGRELGICLSRKRDWITNDGRFATELQIDGTLAAATAERSGVIRQISRLICLGAAWQNSTVSSLVFTSKRQLTALKGLSNSLSRAEMNVLGLTQNPAGPVPVALAKGCAVLLTSGRTATPDGKAEHQIMVSAAQGANAPLAKMLAAAGSPAAKFNNLTLRPLSSLSISASGREFIKDQEVNKTDRARGVHLGLFDEDGAPKKNCTIGYGRLVHPGPCTLTHPSEQEFIDGITESDAERMLDEDLQRISDVLIETFNRAKGKIKPPDGPRLSPSGEVMLTQPMYDAYMSMIFNVGGNADPEWRVFKNALLGKYEAAADEFLTIRKANDKIVKGLENRRARERDLFLNGTY